MLGLSLFLVFNLPTAVSIFTIQRFLYGAIQCLISLGPKNPVKTDGNEDRALDRQRVQNRIAQHRYRRE